MKGNCGECNLRWACDIDPDKCNAWPDPVPISNADRIRAMSDEELDAFLYQVGYYNGWDLEEYALEWLQQPD